MFDDLIALFSGWYAEYVEAIRDLISYDVTSFQVVIDSDGLPYMYDVTNTVNPEIWSAYVPWEQIIAAVVLIVFTVCVFKFMRSVLCKIL